MNRPFYEMKDTELSLWANQISAKLVASPGAYHITPEQAALLAAAAGAYAAALKRWVEPTTRTPPARAGKDAARESLIRAAQYLVPIINKNPATTDAQREDLGIPVRKRPGRVPPPESWPLIEVERVDGARVSIRLRDGASGGGGRGRPEGVACAGIYVAAGESSPEHASGWEFRGLTSKTRVVVDFPISASAGTVWISAKWFNARGEGGAASPPRRVNLPAAEAVPEGNTLKMAA